MPQATKAKSGQRQSGSKGGATARPTDALTLLRRDHHTVKGLFRRFEQAGERAQQTKQKVVEEIERELEIHATIEEEIFYPAVESEVAQAEDLVHEAIEEHRVVRNLLSEITVLEPDDEQYDAKVKVLQENVEHHIEEEETEMFPKVTNALAQVRLMGLGQEMQARKEALGKSTLSRVISGVSNLIFGNGNEEEDETDTSQAGRAEGGSARKQRATSARARGEGGGARARSRKSAADERGEARSQSRRSNGAQARTPRGGRGTAKTPAAKARGGAQARSAGGNARSRTRGGKRSAEGKGGRAVTAQAKRRLAAKRAAARSRSSARSQASAAKKRGVNRTRGSKR